MVYISQNFCHFSIALFVICKINFNLQFCFDSSGGVVIYFDRIEVVNILETSSGKTCSKFAHMQL